VAFDGEGYVACLRLLPYKPALSFSLFSEVRYRRNQNEKSREGKRRDLRREEARNQEKPEEAEEE